MKEEELATVNLRINGNYLSLFVPPHMEAFYRDAEKMLDERALKIKKENAVHHLSDAKVAMILALETMVNNLELKKENENFQQQIDSYLEMLGQSAA